MSEDDLIDFLFKDYKQRMIPFIDKALINSKNKDIYGVENCLSNLGNILEEFETFIYEFEEIEPFEDCNEDEIEEVYKNLTSLMDDLTREIDDYFIGESIEEIISLYKKDNCFIPSYSLDIDLNKPFFDEEPINYTAFFCEISWCVFDPDAFVNYNWIDYDIILDKGLIYEDEKYFSEPSGSDYIIEENDEFELKMPEIQELYSNLFSNSSNTLEIEPFKEIDNYLSGLDSIRKLSVLLMINQELNNSYYPN